MQIFLRRNESKLLVIKVETTILRQAVLKVDKTSGGGQNTPKAIRLYSILKLDDL